MKEHPATPPPRVLIVSELFEEVLLVLLIALFLVMGLIPAWRHLNTDFPNYYLTARLYRAGSPLDRVYEWTWFQRQWDHATSDRQLVSYLPLTFFSALPVLPFSSLPPLPAKRCWLLLNLAFLGLIALLLARLTNLGWRRIALLMFLALFPLRSNFLLGQMHVLVLLLLTLAAWLYFKDQGFWSGVTLAVAAAIKIYPALFIFFFLIKKQWRAACGLLTGIAACGLLSIYLAGVNVCWIYAREVLPWAMRGQTVDPYSAEWGSLNALLSRLFIAEPELNPTPVAHRPFLYALLYSFILAFTFVTFMWAISQGGRDRSRWRLEWGTYLFLLLLFSSQTASYHFVALILSAALVTAWLIERGERRKASALICIYVLVCGSYEGLCPRDPSGWRTLFCFERLFFLIVLGGLLLHLLLSRSETHDVTPRSSRAPLYAALGFLALFVVGFTGSLRHFHGQFDNYASRVAVVPGSLLASEPVVNSSGLFFTALVPHTAASNGYAVHQLAAGSINSLTGEGDWFHPASAQALDTVWTEVAVLGGSRIVGLSPAVPQAALADLVVEVQNGEQPVASPDGEWLAFIREVNGRGSLWIRQIRAMPAQPGTRPEHEIAGPEYDVLEAAFFPDRRVVFSSRQQGRFRLYEVSSNSATIHSGAIGARTIREMAVPTCSARYPAVSPDGEKIAFSCEQGGTWQVHAVNFRTGNEVQLTNGDCNSVSPVWTADSAQLIYATDCGRGLELTALARLKTPW